MSGLVYHAINAVCADLATSGIAKRRRNEEGDYAYRGIEDVLAALSPLLAQHKLCVLPRVLQRDAGRVAGRSDDQLVVLRVAFDFVSAIDGSMHIVESIGEAIDNSDKGTAKAMSAAYKIAMLQAFCIPVAQEDADASSPKINGNYQSHGFAEPPGGWDDWSREVVHIARSCESVEAIDRLVAKRRTQLSALQRSRPELYAQMGEAVAVRLAELGRFKSVHVAAQSRKKKESADADTAAPETP